MNKKSLGNLRIDHILNGQWNIELGWKDRSVWPDISCYFHLTRNACLILATAGDLSLVRRSINLPVGWSQFGVVILSEDWKRVAQRKGENLFSESGDRFSCAIHWPLLLNHHSHWDPLKNQIIFATISTMSLQSTWRWRHLSYLIIEMILLFYFKKSIFYIGQVKDSPLL